MIIVCVILLIPLSILMVTMIVDSIKYPEDYKIPKRWKKRRNSDNVSIRMTNPRMRRYYKEQSRYKS